MSNYEEMKSAEREANSFIINFRWIPKDKNRLAVPFRSNVFTYSPFHVIFSC